MLDLIRGIHLPPFVVGMARGFVEAVLMGGLAGATLWLGEAEDLVIVAPIGYFIIRWLEGIVDQIDKGTPRLPH